MTGNDLRARVEQLERAGRESDAHRLAVLTLLNALVLKNPNAREIVAKFRSLVESFSESAQGVWTLEQIVEFRAHSEQMAIVHEGLISDQESLPP